MPCLARFGTYPEAEYEVDVTASLWASLSLNEGDADQILIGSVGPQADRT